MSFVYVEDVALLIFNIANENQISAYDEGFYTVELSAGSCIGLQIG
jgi:hypothetical protein